MYIFSAILVTNQNFSWGISVGQRIDYDNYREIAYFNDTRFDDYSIIWDFRFYNIIESLPAISNDIDSIGEILHKVNITSYYENGTETSYPFLFYVLPIGNWDLIIDLWLDQPSINESNIIDTPEFVGYNCTWSWDDGNTTHIYTEIYSRSTGVLHTYKSYTPGENSFMLREMVLIPSDDIPVIYILAAGGIVSIVLVAIVLMKRK